MINLDILEDFTSLIDSTILEGAASAALKHQSPKSKAALTIVITDNETVQTLNRQYREIDAPTDVLSFPAGYIDPEDGSLYLGDIIISYPIAAQQAENAGHAIASELQLLVVHGVLHLFGHDHAELKEKKRMWAAQTEILDQLGVSIRSISEI